MDRRKFLIGMGSLAAGGAATIGSGAFSQNTSQRGFSLTIQPDDNDPYLDFNPSSTFATYQNSMFVLNFGDNGNGGAGINARANTRFNNVFEIENTGTNDVYVWMPSYGATNQGPREDAGPASVQFLVDEQNALPAGNGYRYNQGGFTSVDEKDISWPVTIDPDEKPSNPIPDLGGGSNPIGQVKTNYTGLRYPGGSYFLGVGESVSVDVRFTVSNVRNNPDSFDASFFTSASEVEPTSTDDWSV